MKLKILDVSGKEVGDYKIAEADVKNAGTFMHQKYLVNNYQAAYYRSGTASVKTRGTVSGGGAKPYKQKGTGRARRGSSRSTLMRGGAVAFGPQPRDFRIGMKKNR